MINTPCINCGKSKGQHLAGTFHCPLPGRARSFKSFNSVLTYTPRTPTKRDIEKHNEMLKKQLDFKGLET